MALPAGVLGSCTMCVELSTNGTTWTDFSDYLTVITPDAMTRTTGEAAVFGEDVFSTAVGKKNPTEITIRGLYVDATATTNPFSYVWGQWTTTCGGALAVRFAPAGCATTNQVFSQATSTAHTSKIVSMTLPDADAGDAGPVMWEATARSPDLYKATYA